ncbi:hypothetical protein CDD80_262 [Ophiocordyceps camponoti-rufipedis]|uniref:Uncharacterized protein n=1 Tax=Ophiocordyceps camponoti-rufipedis TaxID=2004952 RepID=A0A2C5YI61_9HYPO|nr:hypothetical protein CDD80_262 [Ophiocordyceps camponoti-rufipedis]
MDDPNATIRPRRESKKKLRQKKSTPVSENLSLTSSPTFSAASSRSAAGAPMSPSSTMGDFWRLLPVGTNSRRNSSVAADGQRLRREPSFMASTSSESVVQPATGTPLTPFPPLKAAEPGSSTQRASPGQQHQDEVADGVYGYRWSLNTAMHGAVLFGQCVVTLAVLSGFLYTAIVDKSNVNPVGQEMPWKYAETALGLTLATCVGVLALHETRVLSSVAVLYLQALILIMTMMTSLAMWIWIFTHSTSRIVMGAVVSGVAMLMGTAMLAFFRAALVWWIIEDRGVLGGSGDEVFEN